MGVGEGEALGTVGALSMMEGLGDDDFLVMNGDVLTDLDYTGLMEAHQTTGAVATIATIKRQIQVGLGVLRFTDPQPLTRLMELGVPNYLVNATMLGVLALVDPGGMAGPSEAFALEHGALVLAFSRPGADQRGQPDGRVVVTGSDYGASATVGLWLVDPKDWSRRLLDSAATWFRVAGGLDRARRCDACGQRRADQRFERPRLGPRPGCGRRRG